MAAGEQRWRELASRIAGESGFDLEDFAVVNAGRRRLVKVVIDADDGVSLDDAADVSRRLSEAFDADDDAAADGSAGAAVGALPYTLEVTSPGIGRPLTEARHFHRARTRLISATTSDGRTVSGRVVGVSDVGVDLLTGKSGVEPLTLAFADITKARVEVDFSGPSAAVRAALAADPRSAPLVAADADPSDPSDPSDPDEAVETAEGLEEEGLDDEER